MGFEYTDDIGTTFDHDFHQTPRRGDVSGAHAYDHRRQNPSDDSTINSLFVTSDEVYRPRLDPRTGRLFLSRPPRTGNGKNNPASERYGFLDTDTRGKTCFLLGRSARFRFNELKIGDWSSMNRNEREGRMRETDHTGRVIVFFEEWGRGSRKCRSVSPPFFLERHSGMNVMSGVTPSAIPP